MIGKTGAGWLYSLARHPKSNWGAVEDFYAAVDECDKKRGRIIIDSDVWGNLHSLAAIPVAGDGFAFYHSQRAIFPPDDGFKRKPRISLMGELLDIKLAGRNVEHIRVAVDRRILRAFKAHPIIRDDPTRTFFEDCGIVSGPVASLYHADHRTWAALVACLGKNAI